MHTSWDNCCVVICCVVCCVMRMRFIILIPRGSGVVVGFVLISMEAGGWHGHEVGRSTRWEGDHGLDGLGEL